MKNDQSDKSVDEISRKGEPTHPNHPFAKWRGKIDLGGDELDVYVLNTGDRVLALRSAIKSMSGTVSGNLGSYLGVGSLKPFINQRFDPGRTIGIFNSGNTIYRAWNDN